MKRRICKVNDVRDNKAILAVYGSYNILSEIIPDAIKQIKVNKWDSAEIESLNGVNLVITKYMTIEDAQKTWSIMSEANSKVYKIQREAYENSEDYRLEQEEKKLKEEKRQDYIYHSPKEAIEDVKRVNPIDINSKDLSMADAMSWAKSMVLILSKCEDLNFNLDEQKDFSDALKKAGALSFENLEKIVNSHKFINIKDDAKETNNLAFPLTAMAYLIDMNRDAFTINLAKLNEGGFESGLCATWVQLQDRFEKQENMQKIENSEEAEEVEDRHFGINGFGD